MDALDEFTTTQKTNLSEFENPDQITNDPIDDSSGFIENTPTTVFPSDDQPLTVEDVLFDNPVSIFSNEALSPIQALNKRREEEIAVKDAEENRKIEILRQQAKTDLTNWYNERQRQLEQKLQTMKKEEEEDLQTKSFEKSSKESCDWSKVIRLVNFTDGKQLTSSKRDLTRMKECIFNAKRINEKNKFTNGI